jgi:CBS domain-containing protein
MTYQAQISQKLTGIRDRARIQAHLLSMDAHDVWSAIERELTTLEEQLARSGNAIVASTSEKVSALVERAETFLEHHAGSELTLASPARRIMSAGVLTCLTNDTLNTAAQVMWDEDCGAVPVVDDTGMLLGVLTDRDLAMACYTQGKSPEQVRVASAMSKAVYSVRPDDSLAEVISAMKTHKVRRIPVVTEGGHLLGLISVSDVLRRLSAQRLVSPLEAALLDALIAVSAKSRPTRTVRAAVAAE